MPLAPTLSIAGRKLNFSNLAKPLYPDGFTKADVIEYYRDVSPAMLPHLKNRAVTLKRYPNGSQQPFFFEKNCPEHRPDWIRTQNIAGKEGRSVNHCLINTLPALLWAANLAALEIHVPLALANKPQKPQWMVYDLDPGDPTMLRQCAVIALRLRDHFASLKLQTLVKTSGSKGLHLYVPLNTPTTFDQTKIFARTVAQYLEQESPSEVTTNMSKALRRGKVFIDWSQNDLHKTTVCTYSLRATVKPQVSTPITWDEVQGIASSRRKTSLQFGPRQVLDRIQEHGDLFAPLLKLRQKLPI
jgi:bifunctional non-homologous end joining protein LigD